MSRISMPVLGKAAGRAIDNQASGHRPKYLLIGVLGVVAMFLTAWLAAAAPSAATCAADGPIVDGWRRPPTPAEVKAREASPDCQITVRSAPGVDLSPGTGDKLDQIYRELKHIGHRQDPDGGAHLPAGR